MSKNKILDFNLIIKILSLLTKKEKKQFIFLLFCVIVMAFLDLAGIAAIMPFIGALSNPEYIQSNSFLSSIFENLNFTSHVKFTFFLGILFLILIVTSLFFRLLTNTFLIRWAAMREHSIAKRLFVSYISQPYSWFLTKNSSELSKSVLSEVNTAVYLGIFPLVHIISQGVVVLTLLSLILIVNPFIAILAFSIFAICYFIILTFTTRYLNLIGVERLEQNKLRFESVHDAFNSFKISKLLNNENFLINKFSSHAKLYCKKQSSAEILSTGPRYIIEGVMVVSTVSGLFFIILMNKSFLDFLPLLILYGFASLRLLPCIQQIFLYISKLKFGKASVEFIHKDLCANRNSYTSPPMESLPFRHVIQLEDIKFTYDESSLSTLKGISLDIIKNSCVGIIGKSGSGKTTLVDIIIGLLSPSEGSVMIDRQALGTNSLHSWQRNIGYVPQEIYLSDRSVEYNIAFGVPVGEIDFNAVVSAAKIADIHDYVENDLPNSYQTIVGDKGVRLSGGQKQRIGIARALYHNPEILVFDEATSSLDTETERIVMESIEKLSSIKTIIIIAHRITTLKKCDSIFLLREGRIEKQGNYKDFIQDDLKIA